MTTITPSIATSSIQAPRERAAATAASAFLPARFGIAMTQVHPALWRVSRTAGGLIGHIERHADADGDRFVAKRLLPRGARYLSLGEFWSIDDAVACFRAS